MIREWERGFPERLRVIPGAPEKLYYIGKLPDEGPAAAVVGARSCSAYGRAKARELGRFLAQHGVTVISGLAEGIDGYAHEGALLGNGKTFAVMGCGPDVCYPGSHAGLYEAILEKGGGILSEYPEGTYPAAWRFPARNRIISGLADVVVVVEARRRSGSLITADFALEQGKTVLAFPGRFGDCLSEGTNELIAQGAAIVSSFDAVLEEVIHTFGYAPAMTGRTYPGQKAESESTEFGDEGPENQAKAGCESVKGSEKENAARMVGEAVGWDPVSADELLSCTGGDLAELQSILLDLTLSGEIREVSPGIYEKI